MRVWAEWTDRVWAAPTAVAVLATLTSSTSGVDLWFIDGRYATMVGVCYAISMLFLVVDPGDRRTHFVAAPLGAVWWIGRAIPFVEGALGGDALWGAVWERVLLLVTLLVLHAVTIRRITYIELVGGEL